MRSLSCVIAVVGVIALLTFRDYGLGWDDYTHAEYGDLLLKLYASGFSDQRALSCVNLYYYGGGFDMLAALAAKMLPFTLFETRRLDGRGGGNSRTPRHLAASARRIGGPLAGLIGARAARHLSALLRPHVHEPEGLPLRGGDGDLPARRGARLGAISAACR